ncbi:hypothetical protein K438DRAFT_1833480 [Mycena galopus ATCC 62051]|nr:hypothetical protein K438DRAFT_1833480 [Mycena galopus ATCC 62051]
MPSRAVRWTLSRARRPIHAPSTDQPEEPHCFSSLPPELLIAILDVLDDKSLHLMAAVSKRFYHLAVQSLLLRYGISSTSHQVTLTSSAALRALRIALALYTRDLQALSYIVPSPSSINKDVRRIEAVLNRFTAGTARLQKVCLVFGKNLLAQPVGWTIAGLTPRLLTTICGDSGVGLFVAADGLFTCKPKQMLSWNPYTRERYFKMTLHDGSRQWVPSIRSIKTLDAYPVCRQQWTLVVVNAFEIDTLLLSIRLPRHTWNAILDSITLPAVRDVGIWAETISSEASTSFLNRHHITTLRYMAPYAGPQPIPPAAPALALPHLTRLTALSHYVVHIFSSRAPDALFPQLTHVELFPDATVHEALRLLDTHTTLSRLTLWYSPAIDLEHAFGPILTHVDNLSLNNFDIASAAKHLPAFLAHAFPALERLSVDHSFPLKGKVGTAARAAEKVVLRERKKELVRKIAVENPAVVAFRIDQELFSPG